MMSHSELLSKLEAYVQERPPHGAIVEVNHADPQSSHLPMEYEHTLWMVVGWSNGLAESAKNTRDHVLVARVRLLFSFHRHSI